MRRWKEGEGERERKGKRGEEGLAGYGVCCMHVASEEHVAFCFEINLCENISFLNLKASIKKIYIFCKKNII